MGDTWMMYLLSPMLPANTVGPCVAKPLVSSSMISWPVCRICRGEGAHGWSDMLRGQSKRWMRLHCARAYHGGVLAAQDEEAVLLLVLLRSGLLLLLGSLLLLPRLLLLLAGLALLLLLILPLPALRRLLLASVP